MGEFLGELLTNILEGVFSGEHTPRIIRIVLVALLTVFIVFVGVCVGLHSPMLVGRIFSFLLAFVFLALGVYAIVRIFKIGK